MSNQRDHEIEQASEATKNRLLGWAMALSIVCLVGVLFFAFFTNRAYNDKLCAQANDSREVLRDVLLLSEAQGQRQRFPAVISRENGAKENVTITFPTLGDSERFYEQAIELTEPIKC